MVKIVNNENYVDLEAPINMTEKQREKFIKFMKSIFNDSLGIEEVTEPKLFGERPHVEIKKWEVDDYCALLSSDDNEVVARKTKRTEMGIRMRRGEFIPEFIIWLKKNGYSFSTDKELIKKFLMEKGE